MRAPRGLEQRDEQDRAHHDVDRHGIADAEREVVEDVRDVEHRHRDREREQPVDQRHAARRQPARPARRASIALRAGTRGRSGRARTPGGRRGASSRAAGRSRPCSSGSRTATAAAADDPGAGGRAAGSASRGRTLLELDRLVVVDLQTRSRLLAPQQQQQRLTLRSARRARLEGWATERLVPPALRDAALRAAPGVRSLCSLGLLDQAEGVLAPSAYLIRPFSL